MGGTLDDVGDFFGGVMDNVLGIDPNKGTLFGIGVGKDVAKMARTVGDSALTGMATGIVTDPLMTTTSAAIGGGINAAAGGSFWEGANYAARAQDVIGGNLVGAATDWENSTDRAKAYTGSPGAMDLTIKGAPQAAAGAPTTIDAGTDTAEVDIVGDALRKRIRAGANQRLFGSVGSGATLGTPGTLGTGY